MKFAGRKKRIVAFWLDVLILLSFIYLTFRVVWMFAPEFTIPHTSMALFSRREQWTFQVTAIVTGIFIILYHCLLPLFPARSTPGQYAVGVFLGRPDGSSLTWRESLRRGFSLLIKMFALLFVGPLLAFASGNTALSMIGLFAPILANILICGIAQGKPDGAFLWERLGNYRYFQKESQSPVT